MILLYRVLTQLIYPLLFILIYIRILLKKEDPLRYKEKILISHFNVKRNFKNKLLWFHAASLGELKSILPIIREINLSQKNFEFLVTTSTLSSAKIANIEFKNYENIFHRFLPYDVDFLIYQFLKSWKPSYIFLVDSEIWPNLILKAKKLKIPLAIINARITLKSFKKWMMFPKTASKIFSLIDLCLVSNKETEAFLKKLNVKNIQYNGNIKFISDIKYSNIDNKNKNLLKNKVFWIAASTHPGEEDLCIKTHLLLKEKYKDCLTIIAPRHIDRSIAINYLCEKYKLKTQILNNDQLIDQEKEIVILNSFGILPSYFKYAKCAFIGKSTVKKLENVGGQNPLEAAKLRCKIYHGPYIYNFKDIYEVLHKNNISIQIKDHKELSEHLKKDLNPLNKKNDGISELINNLGNKTLINTLNDINNFIINENK